MMITEGKAANALGGTTARACDSCLKKRARWFCGADDAFLCQGCDTFVHSANQLASRHERVRLETSSFGFMMRGKDERFDCENVMAPKWHQGFTRKARTPRNNKKSASSGKDKEKVAATNSHSLVPEISGDDEEGGSCSPDESDEQISLRRVPVFEPFSAAELCNQLNDGDDHDHGQQLNILLNDDHHGLDIPGFIASDAELAEFAADVESLLGATRIDDDIYGIEELGMAAGKDEEGHNHNHNNLGVCFEEKRVVKIEDDDQDGEEVEAVIACHFDPALDMARESLNWDFQYSISPILPGEEEEEDQEEVKLTNDNMMPLILNKDGESSNKEEERRMMFLKLDYETVITAWASQGSPWADGTKPEFNPDDCWPDFLGTSPGELHHPFGEGGGGRSGGGRHEEREARVLRYKEKRRTRLFSKKIRYEVRKLNAEKRPRMKGRFVKRTSFAGPSFTNYLSNK